ncbi:hypothetical protein K466DRAFT_495396 [Polyporus arcularius HHB13444]|uniref:Uncharacterized protein n=1 Tax=Polyporus arcularius HHB13444 TaxID=1314778 RepID=A0A5C3PA26_9APHY|nr:hypothetical protein K466DRAFT_495396 [Polyporus arcularius HHB13444]
MWTCANRSTDRIQKRWRSCIYAFFKPDVEIDWVDGHRCLVFRCAAKNCKTGKPLRRFLDKGDQSSGGNLFKHARKCLGDEAVDQAKDLGDATRVQATLVANILKNGAITEYFTPLKKGVTYSNRPLTKLQTRYSFRPFAVATDPSFLRLMKIGQPTMYIPSPTTISHDVKLVLTVGCGHLSKMLQKYPGRLHFATNAWTSPNHCPSVAFTVRLELDGSALKILLDVVELAKLHSGINLAETFVDLLVDMGIDKKVSDSNPQNEREACSQASGVIDNERHLQQRGQQ